MELGFAEVGTPLGPIMLATTERGVCALGFADHWPKLVERLTGRFGALQFCTTELSNSAAGDVSAYFAGDLAAIDELVVDVAGTDFQQRVWRSLRKITVGRTRSYQELAAMSGAPAVRAAGTANGANPVSIVIPCHRVIRRSGQLGGYGGGLDRKLWLLNHEGAGVMGLAGSFG